MDKYNLNIKVSNWGRKNISQWGDSKTIAKWILDIYPEFFEQAKKEKKFFEREDFINFLSQEIDLTKLNPEIVKRNGFYCFKPRTPPPKQIIEVHKNNEKQRSLFDFENIPPKVVPTTQALNISQHVKTSIGNDNVAYSINDKKRISPFEKLKNIDRFYKEQDESSRRFSSSLKKPDSVNFKNEANNFNLHSEDVLNSVFYEDERYVDTKQLKDYLKNNKKNNDQDIDYSEFERIKEIIDITAELRFEAEENFKIKSYTAKDKRKSLPISVEKIDDIFTEESDPNQPPRRLITKIAEHIMLIERTVETMRKVLKRKRETVPISRVQQLDSQCIRWLIKQPGASPAQKAGTRQRIMAVVREESFDTLENRVLKDFLKRAETEAEEYYRQYSKYEKFKSSQRLLSVKKLIAVCIKSLALPEMENISVLCEMPVPNYVLQQNPNYSKIWEFYRRLLRQTQLVELIWPIRHRLVFEHILLRLGAFLRLENPKFKHFFQSDFWILESSNNGCFFSNNKWHYVLYNEEKDISIDISIGKNSDIKIKICKINSNMEKNIDFILVPKFAKDIPVRSSFLRGLCIVYNESNLDVNNLFPKAVVISSKKPFLETVSPALKVFFEGVL